MKGNKSSFKIKDLDLKIFNRSTYLLIHLINKAIESQMIVAQLARLISSTKRTKKKKKANLTSGNSTKA